MGGGGLVHFSGYVLLLLRYCFYTYSSIFKVSSSIFDVASISYNSGIFDIKWSWSGLAKQLPKAYSKYCITLYHSSFIGGMM